LTGRDWPDNAERFVFFSRAILEACLALGRAPDVFHLNDYQVGLIGAMLRHEYAGTPLGRSAALLGIHNLGYQGIFPVDAAPAPPPAAPGPGGAGGTAGAAGATSSSGALGAPGERGAAAAPGAPGGERPPVAEALACALGFAPELARPLGPLEFHGRLNFLKGAIRYADLIVAVSPTYAREIATPELGFGLDGVLREREGRLIGILNGIDEEIWDPRTDPLIPANYGPESMQGKGENKARLLEALHLPQQPRLPLIGMISRLVDQKGFDLLAEIADALLERGDLRLVVLGSGQARYEALCRELATRYPKHFAAAVDFNDPLAHLIEAGADFFLMPSRYEPCGLNQMYSMRYGTVPIVRATGGLADTVEEFDPATGRGSGFVFREYEPAALSAAIDRALALYARPQLFRKLVARIMERDFSWKQAAQAYLRAYERAVNERARAGRPRG
ncbi:MAG: glycogen synthase, partial [Candidatus Eisenbacteria bacterium]|nr:glycogen synthase [Candidatus Eisenbacteria bacterium]